jgi:hypothetical protein
VNHYRKTTGNAKEKSTGNCRFRRVPIILDEVADLVLFYCPVPKTERAKNREQEYKKIEKEKRKRESSI